MTDIFELNKSVCATKFKSKAPSRKLLRAMVQEHIEPDCAVYMSFEDYEEVNGRRMVGVDVSFTLSVGFIAGVLTSKII